MDLFKFYDQYGKGKYGRMALLQQESLNAQQKCNIHVDIATVVKKVGAVWYEVSSMFICFTYFSMKMWVLNKSTLVRCF